MRTEPENHDGKTEESPFFRLFVDTPDSFLLRKLEFLREVEKLKQVLRRNYILGGVRLENDAEHSWHAAMMAVLFFENAKSPDVDLLRVLKMLLIHDLVEIDAGDTYAFDQAGHVDKAERENRAADRIFGLLPLKMGAELRRLWEEFDEGRTPDAQFALALDRVQPAIQNYLFRGTVWKENDIRPEQVKDRFEELRQALPELGRFADAMVDDAEQHGFFNQ